MNGFIEVSVGDKLVLLGVRHITSVASCSKEGRRATIYVQEGLESESYDTVIGPEDIKLLIFRTENSESLDVEGLKLDMKTWASMLEDGCDTFAAAEVVAKRLRQASA